MHYHERCGRYHHSHDQQFIGWTNGDRIKPLRPGYKPAEWAYSPEWTPVTALCPVIQREG